MFRMRDDRGAVAVIVAVLMVPLIGFAAISIDVAAVHAEKQQIQAGADAAALAIAQDCARDSCGSPRETAQSFAELNSNSGEVMSSLPSVPTAATGRVTVANYAVRSHWFAPVLGVDSTEVTAFASAAWGSPIGGTAVLPLIFSLCDFKAQTGGGLPSGTLERIILSTKTANTGCTENGNYVPGVFGWLETDTGNSCQATTRIGTNAYSEPGNTPKRCDLSTIRGKTVLLPVFDGEFGGNGRGAWYRVDGYAAFTVTGYNFSGQSWNPPCRGNDRCIGGYFTEMHTTDPDFDYGPGAPNLGASAVHLLPD